MIIDRKQLGALGEKLAKDFLKKRGYRIAETNFKCRSGEIDIIAEQGGCLSFVEVRSKSSLEFGTPEESITPSKKEKLINSALTYLSTHKDLPSQWRIDLVAVELDQNGKTRRIELIQNIIEG